MSNLISGLGSFSKVSKAAKESCPVSKAFTRATSSITPPRAVLTMAAPLFMFEKAIASTTYSF